MTEVTSVRYGPVEIARNLPGLVQAIETFLEDNEELHTDKRALRTAPQEKEDAVKNFYRSLRIETDALIRRGGEIRLLGKLTSLFEKLGLILKKNKTEFVMERQILLNTFFEEPFHIGNGIRLMTATAIRSTLRLNKLAPSLTMLGPVRITDVLHFGFDVDEGFYDPKRDLHLGWTTNITGSGLERRMEIGISPLLLPEDRDKQLRKKVYGSRWCFHGIHGFALDQAETLHRHAIAEGRPREMPQGNISLVTDLADSIKVGDGETPRFSQAFPNLRIDFGKGNIPWQIQRDTRNLGKIISKEMSVTSGWHAPEDIVREGRPL